METNLAAPERESRTSETVTTDREIATTRVFDAPRELVWRVFTTREHVKHWWGPNGFTNTIEEMDVRPGGVWLFVMHGPDGTDYKNRLVFTEVDPPHTLAWDHASGPRFRARVTFEERGDKTEVSLRMVFDTPEERAHVVEKFGAIEGQRQTLERLEVYLAMEDADDAIEIARTFDAPRELVWKAWTEVDRLGDWWGPKGFTWKHGTLDLRPGGVFHYGMTSPDGKVTMWGRFVFKEVVPPKRLAFIISFSDAEGGVTRHPLSAEWPLEIVNVLTFEESAGRTTLRMRGIPVRASEAERRAFAGARHQVEGGFKGTLDQLEAHLAKARG